MGIGTLTRRAVFLDRDGVINPNVYNKATSAWESPHCPEDFELVPWTVDALRQLQEKNFYLFLVSNQPSFAKGKTSLENIKAIQEKLDSILLGHQIRFAEYFYCYHHPRGIVPELSVTCDCRKPGTYFLNEAQIKYSLDMNSCWMVGDRDSDILCGQAAGTKTVLIFNVQELGGTMACQSTPDFQVNDLSEAVALIIRNS